jgi:hypothetical protein
MKLGSSKDSSADNERRPLVPTPEAAVEDARPNRRLAALASFRQSMSSGYGSTALGDASMGSATGAAATSEGVTPTAAGVATYHDDKKAMQGGRSRSLHMMSQNADNVPRTRSSIRASSMGSFKMDPEDGKGPSLARSHSIGPNGSVSYLTPLQMGRSELYEAVPFVAVPGLQKKERNLSLAFASFAANLDTLEVSQASLT